MPFEEEQLVDRSRSLDVPALPRALLYGARGSADSHRASEKIRRRWVSPPPVATGPPEAGGASGRWSPVSGQS